jgi:hypothetical protein
MQHLHTQAVASMKIGENVRRLPEGKGSVDEYWLGRSASTDSVEKLVEFAATGKEGGKK